MFMYLLANYWWVLVIVVLPFLYVAAKKVASKSAHATAIKYLNLVKNSTEATAMLKLDAFVGEAYNVLPGQIRLFVPKSLFIILVNQAYGELKNLADAEAKKAAKALVTTDTVAPPTQSK